MPAAKVQPAPPPSAPAPPPTWQTPVDAQASPILAAIASTIASAFPASPEEREAELRYGPAIRTEHPAKGKFNVVVQSATSELGSEHTLSGRPVYTVYLPAGGGKPWILQFCKPATQSSGSESGPVVRLVAPPRIDPPYPVLTFRPLLAVRSTNPYLYLTGFLNEEGGFETLQALDALEPAILDPLLGWLRLWRFRPAAQDGVPIRVEYLLAIPVQVPTPS